MEKTNQSGFLSVYGFLWIKVYNRIGNRVWRILSSSKENMTSLYKNVYDVCGIIDIE